MIKHTTVDVDYGLFVPKKLQREAFIPPSKPEREGLRNQLPKSIYDDYQVPWQSRKEQYIQYYKNIPHPMDDPSGEKILWWRAAVPHIDPVDIMTDSIAINQVNDTIINDLDYGGKFDMSDLYKVKNPFDESFVNNQISKKDSIRENLQVATKIGGSRSIVANDIITNLNKKLADVNRLPGNKAQLMHMNAVKQHRELVRGKKPLLGPHFNKKLHGGGVFNKGRGSNVLA